jgi:hypothetical protein
LERIEESAFRFSGLASIVIPSCVVVLAEESFFGCKLLGSVTFESGSRLERIHESAFAWTELTSIAIPSSVVVLGKGVFYGCKSLESVTFESGSRLERIDVSAFRSSGLKSIVIPSNVAFICASAFLTDSMSSVSVSGDNRHFRVHDSFLENSCGSMIYRCFRPCYSVVISSSIVDLGEWSFSECKSLQSVTFESGSRLERIGDFAFSGTELRSIEIPSCVVVLGKWSFSQCKSLESVTFENGSRLDRIGESAFSSSGLKSFRTPSWIAVLGA